MIDEKRVENIRTYGVHHNTGAERARILFEDLGLAKDREAEYVILSGCHPPETLPRAFQALKGLLDRLRISYTFLSKETCCGWMPLGQPAVMAKDEAAIAKEVNREEKEVEGLLEKMADKGLCSSFTRDGVRYYVAVPFVPGSSSFSSCGGRRPKRTGAWPD